MNLNQISEQARYSLKKYFRDAYDIENTDSLRKELTYVEMMDMIQRDIKRQKERLNELNMMKKVLEHDAKGAYEYIFGKSETSNETVHHNTMNEMRKKLNENMEEQFSYVNDLKEKTMNK